ncbi:hypothetical protein EMN47_02395 [Prolixibacteraceae bacterium JC049]|nr:hypothetical protein [Prolixibacteraceae bacterium JC049]
MKYKNRYNIKHLVWTVFIVAFASLMACDQMEDVHKEYVEDGETVYIPRPLQVKANSGLNRIELAWKLTSKKQVSECIISYGEDNSVTVPIENNEDTVITHTITDLAEKNYDFTIHAKNKMNQVSLTSKVFGTVYGEKYRVGLSDVRFRNIKILDEGVEFTVAGISRGYVGFNAVYTDLNGNPIDTLILNSAEAVSLNMDIRKPTSFRTAYLPEVTAIDTIYTDLKTMISPSLIELKVEKGNWKVVSTTTEQSGYEAKKFFDDNLDTYWHNSWSVANAPQPLPHVLVIDMNEEANISKIDVHRRLNSNTTNGVLIESSLDNTNWEVLGEMEWSNDKGDNKQGFKLLEVKKGRYLRVSVTKSNDKSWMALAEIYVYKKLSE